MNRRLEWMGEKAQPKIRHTHSWHQMCCVLGWCVFLFLVCHFLFLCVYVDSCPSWWTPGQCGGADSRSSELSLSDIEIICKAQSRRKMSVSQTSASKLNKGMCHFSEVLDCQDLWSWWEKNARGHEDVMDVRAAFTTTCAWGACTMSMYFMLRKVFVTFNGLVSGIDPNSRTETPIEECSPLIDQTK